VASLQHEVSDHVRALANMSPTQLMADLDHSDLVPIVWQKGDPLGWLVDGGPAVVPILCGYVADQTRTKLTLGSAKREQGGPGGVVISDLFDEHLHRVTPATAATRRNEFESRLLNKPFTVTVGDVCFFVIGQIVNREYLPYVFIPGLSKRLSAFI